jgi:uncharacterized protein (TIGR00369 family)
MFNPRSPFPVSSSTAEGANQLIFAPWAKLLGLTDLSVDDGAASAKLPISGDIKHVGGVICGQAIMSAVDMVATLALSSTERVPKATVYQNNHFLRPATGDLRIAATVLKFGRTTAYAEVSVTLADSGDLIARSATEWAF